jgi:hypothetical protein
VALSRSKIKQHSKAKENITKTTAMKNGLSWSQKEAGLYSGF